MKIIFLDINGVLNTERYIEEQIKRNNGEFEYGMQFNFDPAAMENLKEIIDKTDAYIVISSTWRYGCGEEGDEYWLNLMKNLGKYNLDNRVIGVTPFDHGGSVWLTREEEIMMWLKENSDKNVEKFVIIDDSRCIDGALGKYVVRCHQYYGITKCIREKVIDILT